LSEENECVSVAVHCNCMAEENFHFTEDNDIEVNFSFQNLFLSRRCQPWFKSP